MSMTTALQGEGKARSAASILVPMCGAFIHRAQIYRLRRIYFTASVQIDIRLSWIDGCSLERV